MKILVFSQYYFPEDFRINDICEELVRRGHQVTVITGMPNYPEGIVYKGYEKSYKAPEIINGVKVIRCHNRPRKKGILNLLINYVSYYKKANRIVRKMNEKYDVVYGYQMSPIMQVIPGIKYKAKFGVPLYIYVCDLWPESMKDFGSKHISSKNIIYKYFLKLSKKIYTSADRIGTKCEEFIDYLVDVCGVEKQKCAVVYEHAETNYLKASERPIDNRIVDFMYLGNIGHASNCELIIKAASKISNNNFKVHFVGDGSDLNNIKNLTTQLKLDDKVIFHGRCPQKEIVTYYDLADVCLLTLTDDSVVGMTPPAKLAGYMAACRPIIASINGAASRIIKEANCGFVCPANDVEAFAEFMKKAIDNPRCLETFGNNGRTYFLKHLTLEKHITTLENELNFIK